MKIIYIARLFSGLEASMLSQRWKPTGVPAIYKVIEALDAEAADLKIILTKKAAIHSVWTHPSDRMLILDGLRAKVSILAGTEFFPAWMGLLRSKLSEVRQILKILFTSWVFRPDLIYIDHANIWSAGILARFSRRPVVLRLMGVYPAMRAALDGHRPAHHVLRWCYRAPYSAVICTQDGSGIEPWLNRALSPSVPIHRLLNGADPVTGGNDAPSLRGLPSDRCIVMFLGKIEVAKGAPEFIEAFLAARLTVPNHLHALIVGVGSRLADMRQRVEQARAADDVTFIERLTHAEVAAALARSDIYVSLNRLGNLSNANLEAMRAGCCMVIPSSSGDTGIDVFTDKLIPEIAVYRIPSVNDVESLTKALIELSSRPQKRKAMGTAILEATQHALVTWDERIQMEIGLIRSVLHGSQEINSGDLS